MTQDPWGHGADRGSLVTIEAMFLAHIPNLDGKNLDKDKFVKGLCQEGYISNSYLLTAYVGVAGRRSLCSLSLVNQRQLPWVMDIFMLGWMAIAMIFAPIVLCVFNLLLTFSSHHTHLLSLRLSDLLRRLSI